MFTDPELETALMSLDDDLNPAELVLLDVDAELERQDELWGDQSHLPNGTSVEQFKALADLARQQADQAHHRGELSFALILFEEFYEAMAEENEEALETELVQVAAVASQWVKAIRTRRQRNAD